MTPRTPRDLKRASDRTIDELIGLCRGILADGSICEAEIDYLYSWLRQHPEISHHPIGQRLIEIQPRTSQLDPHTEGLLLDTLIQITGAPHPPDEPSAPAEYPFDQPEPRPVLSGKNCCFTGVFDYGSREEVADITSAHGGLVTKNVTRRTQLLIVGANTSPDWKHSTHGRKIERAMELRQAGHPIQIVTEQWWQSIITGDPDHVAD